MSDARIDFDAYFRRIDFSGPVTPTLDTRARLVERHAAAIPFENIDVLAGRVPRLDVASLQTKLVEGRQGGYCFEQNGFFLAALRQAGFVATSLEARVRAGVPAGVVTGRTHMAVRVTLDGEDYLADVGFGGLTPTLPLRLGDREVQHDVIGAFRLRPAEADLLLQHLGRDGWGDCYRITASIPQPVDHELGNWFVATNPNAYLRQNLLVARATKSERLTLLNRTLSRRAHASGQVEERVLSDRAEFADVLADGFGLAVSDADLDAVMAVIERRVHI